MLRRFGVRASSVLACSIQRCSSSSAANNNSGDDFNDFVFFDTAPQEDNIASSSSAPPAAPAGFGTATPTSSRPAATSPAPLHHNLPHSDAARPPEDMAITMEDDEFEILDPVGTAPQEGQQQPSNVSTTASSTTTASQQPPPSQGDWDNLRQKVASPSPSGAHSRLGSPRAATTTARHR